MLIITYFRYLIEDDRAIFMYKDGAQAWEAKDYLVQQERCESVTIESKVYEGKYAKKVRSINYSPRHSMSLEFSVTLMIFFDAI